MSAARRLSVGAGAIIALSLLPAPGAWADVEGPCVATFDGIDVATLSSTDPDQAIEVDENDTAQVEVVSVQPIDRYEVQLSFAGFRWAVASDTASGTSWSRTVEVKDYSRFGVGLYQVHAVSEGATPCEGSVLVKVGGSPFGTPAGWVALGLTGLGVAAVVASARPGHRRFPPAAMALGGLGGLGAVALLQQFAVAYPTRTVALVGIGAGLAAPLVVSRLAPGPRVGGAPSAAPAPPDLTDLPRGPEGELSDLPSGPASDVWQPDRFVPDGGLESWNGPDAVAEASQPLPQGIGVRVLDRVGDRVQVECSNGWTTWLDAAELDGLP